MKSLTDQEGKRLQTLVEATIKEQKESNKVSHCHFPLFFFYSVCLPKFCKSYCFQMLLDDAVLPRVFCNRSLCKISALNRVCYWGLETRELGGDFRAFQLVINNSTCLCVFCLFVCLFVCFSTITAANTYMQ